MTERVLIAGGPRVGKTTLAGKLGRAPVRHTDDLLSYAWSQASEIVSRWMDQPGPWCIEGVAVPRALRKWLERNPTGKPCEVIYWSMDPTVRLTQGQQAMAKGCLTVWMEIMSILRSRGVQIRSFPQAVAA